MTDHPALFNGAMVRGLLREIDQPGSGKTNTRRILKMQPPEWATFCQQPSMLNVLGQWVSSGLWRWSEELQDPPRTLRSWPVDDEGDHYWMRLPIAPGDRLWVRETWAVGNIYDGMSSSKINPERVPLYCGIRYAANHARSGIKDRPSIHMPRWASRLTLYVTDVRVQRLHDITEEDAIAEGCGQYASSTEIKRAFDPDQKGSYRAGFLALWDQIYGVEATDANPWVMAVTFTPRCGNIDVLPAELEIAQEAEHD